MRPSEARIYLFRFIQSDRLEESLAEAGPQARAAKFLVGEVYCSDGRWGEAFDEFCHRRLAIPRYDRWAVPGGPAWLAAREGDGAFAAAAREQLDFLVRVHELERIVLITHYGCAVYGHRLRQTEEECLPVQIKDLRTAAETLRTWHDGIRVEGYLAMRRGRSLSFHELGAWGEKIW